MPKLPEFRRGQTEVNWKADEFNQLVDTVAQNDNLVVGAGLEITNTAEGKYIRLSQQQLTGSPGQLTCVLFSEPSEDFQTLEVISVQYAIGAPNRSGEGSIKPQVATGKYTFRFPAFRVMPAIGFTADDYSGLAWTPPDNGDPFVPTTKDTFFTAVRDGPFWVLSPPPSPGGTGLEQFVIQSLSADGNTLQCFAAEPGDDAQEVFTIARPPGLMQIAWDGKTVGGHEFEYPEGEFGIHRLATPVGNTRGRPEPQVVAPPYLVGEVITAAKLGKVYIPFTRDPVTGESDVLPELKWQQQNADQGFVHEVFRAD